ncbi:SDR family NAD(P)-dependent oxidoreductase [Pedobacter sp. Leaf132]|uniref:SDR family NAD(P)-dependent oxidoreductase n=1 Tax=Pedobacter sp. Leaf132 TaxID=2876557 RepID=UPI001E33359B|nr:SDR family NAD(P)-dependent oxidoreductase [Pedobacter sp. Leaf132]
MKKVIIIGATSGIGEQLARQMAALNYQVGITGKRQLLLNEIERSNPEKICTSCFDVNDDENLIDNLNELVERLGGLDIFIYSAGIGDVNEELNNVIEQNTIRTNVMSFTNVINWAFYYISNQQHGQIAAITSIAGLRGNNIAPAYNASKSYQINYMEALYRKAYQMKLPINILDVRPGYVDTAMAKGDKLFWVTPVAKAARQIIKGIEQKKSVIYVSSRWRLFAWLFKATPRNICKKL